jgi:hypothetical protein
MTRVVLAAAHLDSDPTNNRMGNLRALCQRCHMLHDRPHHLAQRWITYRRRLAAGDLFLGPYPALIPALTSKWTSIGDQPLVGGGCDNDHAKAWFACGWAWYRGGKAGAAKAMCSEKKFTYWKAYQFWPSVGGGNCGYWYGAMSCSNQPLQCDGAESLLTCEVGKLTRRARHR